MFMTSQTLRRMRRKAEGRSGGYSFAREYSSWHKEHCLLTLLGIFVDTIGENKPGRPCGAQLSMFIAGASFVRLWLKLWEKNDPQPWTWPNLVTALRICGLLVVAMSSAAKQGDDGEEGQQQQQQQQQQQDSVGGAEADGSSVWQHLPPLSDGVLAFFGVLFVAMDFLDGYLARRLDQRTALGAHLDGQADALATAFIAMRLRCRGAFSSPLLGLHLAAAPYAWHLVTVAPFTPERLATRCAKLRHPWARPGAGLMALFALLALAIPALAPPQPLSSSSSSSSSSLLGMLGLLLADGSGDDDRRALLIRFAERLCADAAALVSLTSFGLSYMVLFGPLMGITRLGDPPKVDDKGEAAAMARLANAEKTSGGEEGEQQQQKKKK